MNPFRYGQVVSAGDFCPRPELQSALDGNIKAGQNVVLQGERRIGKTSLIHETVRKRKSHRLLYVDLMEIKTVDDFCRRIISALVTLERKSGFLERIIRSFAQLRPSLSVDPVTNQPTVSLDAGIKLQPESIEGLLDFVADLELKKRPVVAFDEFQDILNLADAAKTLAILRGKIQFHTEIPYIFAGSVRNAMNGIFTDPESPLFKSAVILDVGPLPADVFSRFLTRKFAKGDRSVERQVLGRVMEIADGVPGDVQALCACLWDLSNKGDTIAEKHLPAALELIFARESKGYESALVLLTAQQQRCLTGLARMGGAAPLSGAFLAGVGIAQPASVKKALIRLQRIKLIYRHRGEYRFVNPFFRAWLVWKGY